MSGAGYVLKGDPRPFSDEFVGMFTKAFRCPPGMVTYLAKLGDDLGADLTSYDLFFVAMEKNYDLELADEQAERLETVGAVAEFLEALGKPVYAGQEEDV